MKILFLVQLAATLFLCGLIWFVQVVHYPLFARVGESSFVLYEQEHARLTTFVVLLPMVAELVTATLFAIFPPPEVAHWVASGGLALVLIIWATTALASVPAHGALGHGFHAATHARLVATNWSRTAAWTARAGLLLAITARLLR